VLLARQPIYQNDHSIFGFELLFRNDSNLTAMEVGDDTATSEVLVNYCTSITTEIERKHSPLFINVSETFLLSELFLPIDKNHVVIELLERITVTPKLVKAIRAWKMKGFRFALDDFDFSKQWDPILPFVDYIKIDVLHTDMNQVEVNKRSLRAYNAKWLAEKIEDREILNQCVAMGFELFQGYYLAKPKEILGNTIRPASTITIEIIKKANESQSSIGEIAKLVTQDPKLSMQLLKLINSSLFTLPRPINDLKEAITFLGVDLLKKWALMIAFISNSLAPIESCRIVLVRAKACEFIANEKGDQNLQADSAFLAGLLSGVDLLLELDPKHFIANLNLNSSIQKAILNHSGAIGEIVKDVKQIEYYLSQEPEKIHTLELNIIHQFSLAQDWANDVINILEEK